MEIEGVIKVDSGIKGPTLAIFAGVHGNETVGLKAFGQILPNLKLDKGTVYFVIANPKAVEKNVRQLDTNLNRIFNLDSDNGTYECSRAQELKTILDQSDVLLDIHAFNDSEGVPFVICEQETFDLASQLPFSLVSSGFVSIHPGSTDWYMHQQNKSAIVIECGSVLEPDKNTPLAVNSIYLYLKYFGCIDAILQNINGSSIQQDRVEVIKQIYKQTENFKLARSFKNFEPLKEGEVIAIDEDLQYVAGKNEWALFPRPDCPVGGEALIIGRTIDR